MSDCSCNGSGCKCSVDLSPAKEKGMVVKSYDDFNINFETNYSDVDSLIEINEVKADIKFKD